MDEFGTLDPFDDPADFGAKRPLPISFQRATAISYRIAYGDIRSVDIVGLYVQAAARLRAIYAAQAAGRDDCEFGSSSDVIVWLDYTDPSKISEQIREFETLLDRLKPGDIVRITVNASPQALGKSVDAEGKHLPAQEVRAKRLQKLKDRIGDYLPSWVDHDKITDEYLPSVLSASLGNAALKAFPTNAKNCFTPLSVVRYADGQQMLSITGAVVGREDETALRKKLDLDSWPFASTDWSMVHRLVVPALTVRERLFLERGIVSKPTATLISDLGFQEASEISMSDFLDNYKDYYRFYPTLLSAEI